MDDSISANSGNDTDGDNQHLECSVCLQTPELKWTLPCGHYFCYLCLKGSIEANDSGCPICRGSIPDDVYERARMDMNLLDMEDVDHRWLYSGRNNGWWAYTDSHNCIIEAAYQEFQNEEGDSNSFSVDINIYGKNYTVNFLNMTQISPTGDWRNIKRLSADKPLDGSDGKSLKGIAGIQAER